MKTQGGEIQSIKMWNQIRQRMYVSTSITQKEFCDLCSKMWEQLNDERGNNCGKLAHALWTDLTQCKPKSCGNLMILN